jgi:hypothetical protein
MKTLVLALVLTVLTAGSLIAVPETNEAKIQTLVAQRNVTELKSMGPGILPVLIRMYQVSDESRKAAIAGVLYGLGWKSPEAKQVLMADVHTKNQSLRLDVQYALGRVSDDIDVVDVLLDNMRNDANPLFRDKAACALAYDQIHLTEKQKVHLYEGLIGSLDDPKVDVRSIAALALNIHTGQTKGFDANAAPAQRQAAIREWRKWLDEYRLRW